MRHRGLQVFRSSLLCAASTFAACGPQLQSPGFVAAEVAAHSDPLAALRSHDAALAANKRLVFDLWRGVVNAGHVELADELLADDYIQHSPVLRTGRKAFKEIFSVVPRREIPALVQPPLVAIVAEGDLVAMSLRETIPARDGMSAYTSTHFNLFRVANGRLVEHWHSVQTPPGPDVPLPAEGGPQPVIGATGQAQQALLDSADRSLAANKRLVFDMWREVVDAGRQKAAGRYFDAGFVDYSATPGAGIDGFNARFVGRPANAVDSAIRAPVVAVVAEGDLVVLVTMREHPHPTRAGRTYTTTWFDMFRIANGGVAAHWDAALRTTDPRP
jgi:predicted SnoaL-like aldol condensation-catalyzing enzyme